MLTRLHIKNFKRFKEVDFLHDSLHKLRSVGGFVVHGILR